MRVAVDDRVAARETGREPLRPPGARSGDVHHPDPRAGHLHEAPLRKQLGKRELVHVPVDRLDRGVAAQLLEHGGLDEVSRVQDQVGLLQLPQALGGQPARPAREMRVGEDGDARQR